MKVSATINATSLRDSLKRLDKRYQVAIDKEIGVTAREIESSYKVNVPLDTGRLRSSIHVETSGKKGYSYGDKRGNTYNGSFETKAELNEAIIGTNVQYANIIEQRGGKVKGQNALKNAFETHTKGIESRIARILKSEMP